MSNNETEPDKESETVYFVTAPFANCEEEITTSYIIHDNHVHSDDQVIVVNEDGCILINDDTTFVDEDGNPIIVNRRNIDIESEQFTVEIKEEPDSRDAFDVNSSPIHQLETAADPNVSPNLEPNTSFTEIEEQNIDAQGGLNTVGENIQNVDKQGKQNGFGHVIQNVGEQGIQTIVAQESINALGQEIQNVGEERIQEVVEQDIQNVLGQEIQNVPGQGIQNVVGQGIQNVVGQGIQNVGQEMQNVVGQEIQNVVGQGIQNVAGQGNQTVTEQEILSLFKSKFPNKKITKRLMSKLKDIPLKRRKYERKTPPKIPVVKPHEAVSILTREGNHFIKDGGTVTSFEDNAACMSISQVDNDEETGPENVTVFIPDDVVVDNLTCRYCMKTFTRKGNMQRHIRMFHNIKKKIGTYIRCIECNITYKHVQKLRDHLQLVHKLNMDQEEMFFPNMAAFRKWKHDIEQKDMTSFTVRHGAKKTLQGIKYFYVCHRAGKFTKSCNRPRQRMIKAAGTCKLGIMCTAAMYCEDRSDTVYVKYCSHHYGHGNEASFVQLSTEEQNAIQENLSNGIPFEDLLDDIRESSSKDHHFALMLKKKDIMFINKAFNTQEYSPGLTDAESVDKWVEQCCQMEDSPILLYKQEEDPSKEEDFMLVIMTEFQKHILTSSDKKVVSVDSLYRRKGGRFYLTCLFVMDECEVPFPVAFCISHKVDKDMIKVFLNCIKESTGPLSCTYFMSDCESIYYEAWMDVMNDDSKWLWSLWYVDNRFRVRLKVYKGNVAKRAEVYKTMRKLMECQNPSVFETMYKNYVDSLMSDPQSKILGNFLVQRYSNNKEYWANCFHKDIKLSTIIKLESLHRTLRYCCREGRKRRLDKFILVIMKLVRYKMLGRLTNMMDSEKISLAIDAIDMCHSIGLEIPTDRISSLSDHIWLIKGDDEDESVYVTKDFDSCPEHCVLRCGECDICVHTFSCSCTHSMINANLCQHIHAVVWKFLTPHFSPMNSPARDDIEEIENIDFSAVVDKSPTELLENVLKRSHDVYKKVRSNKGTLSHESLTSIMQRLNECVDICLGKKVTQSDPPDKNSVFAESNPPHNTNFQSQPFILPSSLPAIAPQNQSISQYVLILPNNFNNGGFVPK